MKRIFLGLGILICVLSAPCVYGEVDADRFLQQTQQALQSPGVKRFNNMRFFVATNVLPQKPGFWESLFSSDTGKNHQRALAIYLFNMYISTQYYQQSPNVLTLNYLGVLDAVVQGPDNFDTQHATEFYQKNQKQIDGLLRQFRQKVSRKWAAPTQKQILSWLTLLEKQPRKSGKPVYIYPAQNVLKGSLVPALSARLEAAATAAQKQAQKQVILAAKQFLRDRGIGPVFRWTKTHLS